MKLLSWNIAAGHIFKKNISNALHHENYDIEDLNYFIDEIKKTDADVVFLQETHSEGEKSQGKIIAEKLSYQFYREHAYGKSHIEKGKQLTLVTLSRYPILSAFFHALPNPNLTIQRPNGEQWVTLNMGFLVTEVTIHNIKVNFANCHLIPLHYFKRHFAEPDFQYMRDDLTEFLNNLAQKPAIAGGDYNYADLKQIIPSAFSHNLYNEAFTKTETAPGKGQQDHIIFTSQWNLDNVLLEKVKADHYKCIIEVSLNDE